MSEDIIENLDMAAPGDPWFWAKVVVVILVLCAPALWYVLRLRRQGRLPFQRPPAPPEVDALERLAAVRRLIDDGLYREFSMEASGILRTYIEARFGVRAPRLSTEEFLYEAERSEHLDAGARARLADFLFRCDRVKFALGTLDRGGMEDLYASARTFIAGSTLPAGEEAAP